MRFLVFCGLIAAVWSSNVSCAGSNDVLVELHDTEAILRHRQWSGNEWRYILPEHVIPVSSLHEIVPEPPDSADGKYILSGVTRGEQPAAYRITLTPRADVVDMEMWIANIGEVQWAPSAFSVLCFRHAKSTDFFDPDRSHAFVHTDGEFVAVKTLHPQYKHSQHLLREADREWASKREKKRYLAGRALVDAGLIVRTSQDDTRQIGITWESARSVSYNMSHPDYNCQHAQPRFGALEPGESVAIRGRLYFFTGSKEALFKRYLKDFPDRGFMQIPPETE